MVRRRHSPGSGLRGPRVSQPRADSPASVAGPFRRKAEASQGGARGVVGEEAGRVVSVSWEQRGGTCPGRGTVLLAPGGGRRDVRGSQPLGDRRWRQEGAIPTAGRKKRRLPDSSSHSRLLAAGPGPG